MKNPFLILTLLIFPIFSAFSAEFYFEENHSLPLVYFNLAFKGGSTQDPDGKSGLTDLTAKLLLRGSKYKSKQQVNLTLDQLGADLEVETRGEFVVIRGKVLSENMASYLRLIEEIITAPSFSTQELELLKKEQISKILEQLDHDQKLIKVKFDQVFFKGHPYSKSGLGKADEIKTFSFADIQNHYRKIFNQERMLILSTGDTERSIFEPFLKTIREKLDFNTSINPIGPYQNFPEKLRIVIFDKPERTQTQISIAQAGTRFDDPTLDALKLANHTFGGGTFQSKLMVELRVKRGWTYGAGSAFKMGSQPHSWRVSFFPKNSDTPPAIHEALKLIKELRENGITRQEFESARKSLINGAGFDFNTPTKRMENQMVEKLFGLPEGYHRDFAKRLQKLTLEDVNEALKKFIQPQKLMVGLVATSSISKPAIAKELGMDEKEIEVIDYSL